MRGSISNNLRNNNCSKFLIHSNNGIHCIYLFLVLVPPLTYCAAGNTLLKSPLIKLLVQVIGKVQSLPLPTGGHCCTIIQAQTFTSTNTEIGWVFIATKYLNFKTTFCIDKFNTTRFNFNILHIFQDNLLV